MSGARANVLVVALVATLLLFPWDVAAETRAEAAQRAAAVARPILDGVGLAGLRLGQDEQVALQLLGGPQTVDASDLAERVLRYDVVPGIRLHVHVGAGTIRALSLQVTAEGRAPARSPRTARAISLGAPLAAVMERYGPRADSQLWYAADGIAFNVGSPAATVVSILIFPRGMPAP
jgi:hypothetical protein